MSTKKIISVTIFALIAILVVVVVIKGSDYWKNNRYRFLSGKHLYLKLEDKELFWFDVVHSNNPNDVMFQLIQEKFKAFTPDLVLVEGGGNSFEGNRDEALRSGENCFGTFLAKEANVCVEDIEPPFTKQIAYLRQKYSDEEIFAMYTLRQIGSMELMPNNVSADFDTFASIFINEFKSYGLDYKGKSADDVLNTLNKYVPQEMNRNNWLNLKVYRVYAKTGNIINDIYEDMYPYRNVYLIELIKEKKQTYNRIFIIEGGQHLIDTKEELQKIYSTL